MSVIQEMRDAAEQLEPGSQVRKMLTWAELELGERADQIFSLEEELKEESDLRVKLEDALHKAKHALEQAADALGAALFTPAPTPRDTSGFARISQVKKQKKVKP